MSSDTAGLPADCAKCGAALRTSALFCARCGTRVLPVEPEQQDQQEQLAASEPASPSVDRWHELRVVGWLYGLLLFSSLFFGLAYRVEPEGDFLPWVSLIDAIVVLGFAGYYREEIVSLLRPSTLDRNALKWLAIASVIMFAGLGTAFHLLEQTGVPFERITDEIERHDYTLWQLLVLFSLVPAVFEEVAFRGIIFERLRRVLGEKEGWLVQAAFFSVLHLSPVIFLTHFAMGLILGWLRIRTRSLLPGMILHASWNAVSIVLELYQ